MNDMTNATGGQQSSSDLPDPLRAVLADLTDVLGKVPAEQIASLAGAVEAARAVFVTGRGRSGLMAQAFAMRLMQLGLKAHVVGDATCPAIGAGDLLVAVSGSGATESTVHIAQRAARHGARVFAVTGAPESPLAQCSRDMLVVPPPEQESRQPGMTFFEQAALLLLDAVVVELMGRMGVTDAALLARHTNLE